MLCMHVELNRTKSEHSTHSATSQYYDRNRKIEQQSNWFIQLYRSNITPNAQESEDSGLSLSYSILGSDAAKRISSSSSSFSEQDHDKDLFDEDILRQKTSSKGSTSSGNSNHEYDLRCVIYNGISFTCNLWLNFVSPHSHLISNAPTCSQFTRITTIEQRRKYKTEFDNDYAEYMRLHADTERVSKRFAYLEENLRNEMNNDQRYKVRHPNLDSNFVNLIDFIADILTLLFLRRKFNVRY